MRRPCFSGEKGVPAACAPGSMSGYGNEEGEFMTLEKIAQDLGVSKSTVSRALSGKGRIGDATRKRIREYATAMGAHEAGKPGKRTFTGNLGVVLPADVYVSGAPFFQECILGICETASFLDYNVLITTATPENVDGIRSLVEKEKVDGVILTRSLENDRALQYLTEAGFPTGLTGQTPRPGIIRVDTDNEMAAENLVSLLLGRGYRHFALVLDDMEYMVNKSRYRGFCNALARHGLDPEKQMLLFGPLKVDMLDSVIGSMLSRRVQCVICGDDIICTRFMSCLQAEGYRIPRDIGVASLFDSPNLDCFTPSVTTVRVSARQVGNVISRQMIHSLTGKEYQEETIVDYEILMRRSTNVTL